MLCEKNRKRDSDTEQRIHYFDGVLPFPVIQSFGKMFYEKSGNQQYDTKRRICYTDDILPPSSSR